MEKFFKFIYFLRKKEGCILILLLTFFVFLFGEIVGGINEGFHTLLRIIKFICVVSSIYSVAYAIKKYKL